MNNIILISIIIVTMILLLYFIPYSTLDIENLKKFYYVGESITFTAKQIGCNLSCDNYKIYISDENKTIVWSSAIVIDGQPPWIIPKMFWNSENIVGDIQDGPIVDRPGEYTVKYETKISSVEKKFTAIPSIINSKNIITPKKIPFTFYVSNQSFIHDPIDITITLDDKTIVSNFFEVKGETVFIHFILS